MANFDWKGKAVVIPLRVITYVMCCFYAGSIIFRVLRFLTEKDPFFFIYTVYLLLFIAMLVVADLKIRKVLDLFSFLEPWLGKGIFIILIGMVLFNWNHYFEFATSFVSLFVGVVYIIYGFKFDNFKDPWANKQGGNLPGRQPQNNERVDQYRADAPPSGQNSASQPGQPPVSDPQNVGYDPNQPV